MEIIDFIKSKASEIKTFVEIGTHFGNDTVEFRKALPEARIVSFEPDSRNVSIAKNLWGDRHIAELYEYALSNESGKTEFYLSSGSCKHLFGEWSTGTDALLRNNPWSASNSLKKPKIHLETWPWVKFDEKVEVECIKLDDFEPLKDVTIDFIWADVQGAEDLVFEGAQETLKRTKYVFTEYNNEELYEGQPNLNKLLEVFGPDWEVLHDYSCDVLLKNKNFN